MTPALALTLAFSDGTAALAEQPLQEQPSGAAVARMMTADDITSSELVSALGRGAEEAAEVARLAGGAWKGAAGESQAAFAGGGSLSRVIAGKLVPTFASTALTAADQLQVPRQRQPSLALLALAPLALARFARGSLRSLPSLGHCRRQGEREALHRVQRRG